MKQNKLFWLTILLLLFTVMSCRSKKETIIDKTTITDVVTIDSTSVKNISSTETERVFSDSVFVFVVDSISKDSDGVVHHWHDYRVVQKQKEFISQNKDTISTGGTVKTSTKEKVTENNTKVTVSKKMNNIYIGIIISIVIISIITFIIYKVKDR